MKSLATVLALCAALPACSLAAGQIPAQDSRNTKLPEVNSRATMPQFATREAWQQRAADLRKQILSSAGLLPLPAKTPLHAQVFGRQERKGFSVEKVLLETYPGFYLGGNLYRPLGKPGPFPAIVSPHGHWAYGRLENTAIVSIPGRAINLARQGFVVFTYDMVGYNDTTQFPHGDTGPSIGGAHEDLWSINVMGLQLWNSIRAVDFLQALPDVDPARISATGASGGAAQIFLLTAVDDRIQASAPVNMISFLHQGAGCQEAPNLRVDANNVVFGAMMAPRPLLMVSASGDWTRNTPQEEFPAIQGIYRLLDAAQNVTQIQINAPHNYNKDSREAVYRFLNEQVLGGHGPVSETSFSVEPLQNVLALFAKPLPETALTQEKYVAAKIADARAEVEALHPHDAASLERARSVFREQLRYSLLAAQPAPEMVIAETSPATSPGVASGERLLLGRAGKGDRIPALGLKLDHPNTSRIPTLLIYPEGIAAAAKSPLARNLVGAGVPVLVIDAFQTGSAKAPRDTARPGFTVFNQTNDANRVQDILTAIAYLKKRTGHETVNLVGIGNAGIWTLFARALAPGGVVLAADLNHFHADDDSDYMARFFVPGIRKAGSFYAALTLATQGKLLLQNADPNFPADWMKDAALAGGTSAEIRNRPLSDGALASWLTK